MVITSLHFQGNICLQCILTNQQLSFNIRINETKLHTRPKNTTYTLQQNFSIFRNITKLKIDIKYLRK